MTLPVPDPAKPKDVQTVETIGAATQNLNAPKVKTTAQGRMSSGFLNSTGGLTSGLATTATNMFGAFVGNIADDTKPEVTVNNPQDVSNQVQGFFSNPASKLFDGVLGFLSPILQGLTGGLSGLAGSLAGLMGMRWNQVDQHNTDILDLQLDTQKLLGIIGYGSAAMTQHQTPGTSFAVVRFNYPYGPREGCTYSTSTFRYTLQSKGLWEVNAKIRWDIILFQDTNTEMKIVVRAPNGSVHYESGVMDSGSDQVTNLDTTRFVVPAAGYTVEVQALSESVARGILGTTSYSAFNILKISDETS